MTTPQGVSYNNGFGGLIFPNINGQNKGHFRVAIVTNASTAKSTDANSSYVTLVANHILHPIRILFIDKEPNYFKPALSSAFGG
ncbi:MAG: hypothetical protein KDI79_12385 [Anaerolineae bacterium]|nr:hypothetical protein [Anaerolineae bacterium]